MWPVGQELLQVTWQTFPADTFKEPTISTVKIDGIKPSQPQASAEPYRPPNARGINITPTVSQNDYHKIAKAQRHAKRTQRKEQSQRQAQEESVGGDAATAAAAGQDNIKKLPAPQKDREAEKAAKRMKVIQKKISEICKLKVRQDNGEHLDAKLLAKINSEADLTKELQGMKMT